MKAIIYKRLLILFLLAMSLLASCMPQTAVSISEGTALKREETYDDIVFCGHGYSYRANCTPEQRAKPGSVKESEVNLTGCIFAPYVTYRDSIETRAGQVRYNVIYMDMPGIFKKLNSLTEIFNMRGEPIKIAKYIIKLKEEPPDFHVTNVGQDIVMPFYGQQVNFMIEIPAQVKPGDYTLDFIVEADGWYCGKFPCVIHVVE